MEYLGGASNLYGGFTGLINLPLLLTELGPLKQNSAIKQEQPIPKGVKSPHFFGSKMNLSFIFALAYSAIVSIGADTENFLLGCAAGVCCGVASVLAFCAMTGVGVGEHRRNRAFYRAVARPTWCRGTLSAHARETKFNMLMADRDNRVHNLKIAVVLAHTLGIFGLTVTVIQLLKGDVFPLCVGSTLTGLQACVWQRKLTVDGDVENNPGPRGRGGRGGRGAGRGRGHGATGRGGRGGGTPQPSNDTVYTSDAVDLGFFSQLLVDVVKPLPGESCVDVVVRTITNVAVGAPIDKPLGTDTIPNASIEEMKALTKYGSYMEMWSTMTRAVHSENGHAIRLDYLRIQNNRLFATVHDELAVSNYVVCYSASTPTVDEAHWVIGRKRNGIVTTPFQTVVPDDWAAPLVTLHARLMDGSPDYDGTDIPGPYTYEIVAQNAGGTQVVGEIETQTPPTPLLDATSSTTDDVHILNATPADDLYCAARSDDYRADDPLTEDTGPTSTTLTAGTKIMQQQLIVGPIPPPVALEAELATGTEMRLSTFPPVRATVIWRPSHGVVFDDHKHEIEARRLQNTLCECFTYPLCEHSHGNIYVQADPNNTLVVRELFARNAVRFIAPSGNDALQLGDRVVNARTQRTYGVRGGPFSVFRVHAESAHVNFRSGCKAVGCAIVGAIESWCTPRAIRMMRDAHMHIGTSFQDNVCRRIGNLWPKLQLRTLVGECQRIHPTRQLETNFDDVYPTFSHRILAKIGSAFHKHVCLGIGARWPKFVMQACRLPPPTDRPVTVASTGTVTHVTPVNANLLQCEPILDCCPSRRFLFGLTLPNNVREIFCRDSATTILKCIALVGVLRMTYALFCKFCGPKRPRFGGSLSGWQFVTPTRLQTVLLALGSASYTVVEPEFEEAIRKFIGPAALPGAVKSMLRRAALIDNGDQVTARGLLVRAAVESDYGFKIHKETVNYLIRIATRTSTMYPGAAKKTVNAETAILARPRGRLIAGPNQDCYWCDLPYEGNGKFHGRMCPHHYNMLMKNSYPRADTIDALLASENGHSDRTILAGYNGPVVSMPEFKPLKGGMTFFPLEKMFSATVKARIEKYMVSPKEVVSSKTVVALGYSIATQGVTTIAKGNAAIAQALVCRVGQIPRMEPKQYAFDLGLQLLRRLTFARGVCPMSFQQWLATVRRQNDMMKAFVEIETMGGTEVWVRKHEKPEWKAFVKQEKIPAGESVQKPRIIQAPPDAVHVILGRKMKTILHVLSDEWTWNSSIFYAGCARPHELHLWLARLAKLTNYQFLCIDYKMFDCTHSNMSFEMVEAIYAEIVNLDAADRKLLRNLRIPRGRAQDIKYKAPKEMNGSGRPDTSLLNIVNSVTALAVMCTVVITGKEVADITVEDVMNHKRFWLLAASGDDSVVALPKSIYLNGVQRHIHVDKALVERTIGAFGFDAAADKVNIYDDFSDVVFLGHRPYPVGNGNGGKEWFWGPTLGRRLYKHHHMLNPTGDVRAWLHGVAQMEVINYPHVPILYDMASNVCTQFTGQKVNPFYDKEAAYKASFISDDLIPPPYDNITIEHVERVYGMAPGDVRSCISALGSVPQAVDHQALYRCLEVDDL